MTWYDPEEIKYQADNDQVQPEFAPMHDLLGEVYGDTEGGASDEMTALEERINEIAEIVATGITNGPEATG